ncbi:MAG: hypothetical protein ACRD36_10765, partial [Candidatus Acidiferrum sp.]
AEREAPLRAFQSANDRAALLAVRFQRFFQLGEPATGSKPRKILTFVPSVIAGREAKPGSARVAPLGAPAALAWNPPASGEASGKRDMGAPASGRYRGRVVLLNTSANSDWSNWPASPSYPAFIQELLHFAAAGKLRERDSIAGEPLELSLPNLPAGDATIHTPEGHAEIVRMRNLDDAALLRWSDTDASGIYLAIPSANQREHLFAVNVPVTNDQQQANESDLARTNEEELKRVYPEWDLQVVRDPSQIHRTAMTATGDAVVERQQGPSVAHWLLLMALTLVLAEIVLAWQFGHYSDVEREAPTSEIRSGGAGYGQLLLRLSLRVLPFLLFAVVLTIGGILLHDAVTGDFLGFLPNSVRHGFENWLNVPEPAAGEGSRWRLEYSSY